MRRCIDIRDLIVTWLEFGDKLGHMAIENEQEI